MAATLTVGDYPHTYSTITDALKDAQNGDTIELYGKAGGYKLFDEANGGEPKNIQVQGGEQGNGFAFNGMTIKGAYGENVVIDGNYDNVDRTVDKNEYAFRVPSATKNLRIENLTIRNVFQGAVYLIEGCKEIYMRDCIFEDNSGYAVYADRGQDLTFLNCDFLRTRSESGGGYGLYVSASSEEFMGELRLG